MDIGNTFEIKYRSYRY